MTWRWRIAGDTPVAISDASPKAMAASAVADLSLDIAGGEFVTLLGPSGRERPRC